MGNHKVVVMFDAKEDRTKQSFREECDINVLLNKYHKTGKLPALIKGNPMYGDYTNAPDFMEAQEILLKANQQFAGLPANLRDRFQNDVTKFLNFVNDEKNNDELLKLGLIIEKPKNPVAQVEPGITTPEEVKK